MKKAVKKLADVVSKTKGRPPRKTPTNKGLGDKEQLWEPSDRDLAWYHEWSVNHLGFAEIGRRCNPSVTRFRVWHSIKKTSDWFRANMIDDIVAQRHRQTETLESIAAKFLSAWEESRGKRQVTTVKATQGKGDGDKGVVDEISTREELFFGESSYLSGAMQALSDIRKIWGLEVPKQVAVQVNDESGLLRVDGLGRKEARLKQAEALLAKAGIAIGEVTPGGSTTNDHPTTP